MADDTCEPFLGFSYPDDKDEETGKAKGFTRIPNDWFETCSRIKDLAELKIILYIMRHTWGFNEYNLPRRLTIDELAHGRKHKDKTRMDSDTGLGLTAVKDGIKRALEHGYLLHGVDRSDLGRIKKIYLLRMRDWKAPE